MGHGAFGTAAEYPLLLAPLTPPLSLCLLRLDQCHGGRERLTFRDEGLNPEATYFLPSPNSAAVRTERTRQRRHRLTQRHKDHRGLKERRNLHTTTTRSGKISEASHNQ